MDGQAIKRKRDDVKMDMHDIYQLSYELDNCQDDEYEALREHWGLDRKIVNTRVNVAIENEYQARMEQERIEDMNIF